MLPSGRIVSVVIPTRNRPESLATCLEALEGQSVQPDEILVVDGSDALDWKVERVMSEMRKRNLLTGAA